VTRGAPIALAVLAMVAGCDPWDPAIRARDLARETFACENVDIQQIEDARWHATGCGHEGDFACTSGQLSPTCMQVRTAGAEHPIEDDEPAPDTRSVAASEAALYASQHDAGPPLAQVAETSTAAEDAIRAGLDAHRGDVYACTQHDPTVVRVDYAVDGSLDVHLAGGLAGTPEEGCVRAALEGARAPAGSSGTVLHLVHGS